VVPAPSIAAELTHNHLPSQAPSNLPQHAAHQACYAPDSLKRSARQPQPAAGMPAYAASNQFCGKLHSSSGSRSQRMPCRQLQPHSPHSSSHSSDCCR
jgi:hypothetical protein